MRIRRILSSRIVPSLKFLQLYQDLGFLSIFFFLIITYRTFRNQINEIDSKLTSKFQNETQLFLNLTDAVYMVEEKTSLHKAVEALIM